MTLKSVVLGDKYDLTKSQVLLSGTQALVRLTLMQKERDRAAGLNTAGYISGYRGSPLGGVDQQFWRAQPVLQKNDIVFQSGLNEDLAATALWGTQQAEMRGEGKYDGVFGMWYGKGPGVDRTGDVFRHANMAGTSKNGGVLVLMGDDHGAESSTVAHQSEMALVDAMMPVLHPAGVQEILDFGMLGIALSRYAGVWVGLKCVHDNIESTAVVDGAPDRIEISVPSDFEMPQGGLNIRPWDDRLDQERRLHKHKRFAATAFARANGLNRIVFGGGKSPRIGIATTGKSYLDTREALESLGIDEVAAARLGIRLLKVGLVWPLEPQIVAEFARGLDLIIVVEEKRSLIETQIRELLYGAKNAPEIIGKKDEAGGELFPAFGTLEPNRIAIALAERLQKRQGDEAVAKHLEAIQAARAAVSNAPDPAVRMPYFCAGCPHNSSTTVPEGGRAYAGIGCHYMAQFVPSRRTEGSTQMGGEGANWIGEAPFSTRKHVFQNLGDGTYNHSGLLAIRAAVAAGVTMTYKILFNDAVAMTGGQPNDGALTVPAIARQVAAEGVTRIVIVSDEPEKHKTTSGLPDGITIHHRDSLDTVQKQLMEQDGVSVLIYDQTCAAEKRRRRKRGTFPDPARRVFINELVCEGCGDCGVQSNCVAIQPLETEFGRKRRIEQSICNKDFSCLKGFCPSFVTVEGGVLVSGKGTGVAADAGPFPVLPEAELPDLAKPYGVLVTGIGGTGVVTVGAVLAMAAHLEGKAAATIDMAGLAQKNGAVVTHMKIAARPEDINAIRVAAGRADLLLGCDIVTTASRHVLSAASRERTRAIVNDHEIMPAMFTQMPDYKLPSQQLKVSIEARTRPNGAAFVDATRIARALLGDTIAANMFTLGFAWQKGTIPIGREAIEKAIALNGVAIELNQQAFLWGRRAAHDLDAVERIVARGRDDKGTDRELSGSLDEVISRRADFLTLYQNAAYAQRYLDRVNAIRTVEAKVAPGSSALTDAVARYLFKLMSYKDEYEVARLYTDGSFAKAVGQAFTGGYRLKVHLAPPLLASRDPATGRPRKSAYGPWVFIVFRILARMKGLRGSRLDPFGHSSERRTERRLLAEYETMIDEIGGGLDGSNLQAAVTLAALPEQVRGFGPVKMQTVAAYDRARANLMETFLRGKQAAAAAE